MSILKYEKYSENSIDESRYQGIQVEPIIFDDVHELLNWIESLKNYNNSIIREKINSLNPTSLKVLQRKLIRLYDDAEIETDKDAIKFIMGDVEPLKESKRILNHTEYDKYLMDKEYMIFYNNVKDRILQLFPDHNISNIELLIDKIYTYYKLNYTIDDTVNKLYMSGYLYTFWVAALDS